MTKITLIEAQKQVMQLIADNWELIVEKGLYVTPTKCRNDTMLMMVGGILDNEVNIMSEMDTTEQLAAKLAAAKQYFEELKGENHE